MSVFKMSRGLSRFGQLFFALLWCPFFAEAQTLEYLDFKRQVLENHPFIKQADLFLEQAKANQVRARGGFDPKAYAEHTGKNFNGKTYFQYTEAGVKLPTWAGLELKGAYNLASGTFLNTESKLPKDGQVSFGLNWSLGQGLFFDERRAGLQLAKVGIDLSNAERLAARNDFLLEATKAYWSWNYATNALEIVSDALKQAAIRHDGLRQSYLQGERSAFDTLETFIQVQSRQVDLQFAQTEVQNANLALAQFLWTADNQMFTPAQIPKAPMLFQTEASVERPMNLENMLGEARIAHPELRQYQAKLRMQATERRLKMEKRKPILDVSYYLLGDGWQFFPTVSAEGPAMLTNDLKWGFNFSYPILNRKARGDWQLTQLKVVQTELELMQKQQSVETKIRQYANEWENLRKQVKLFQEVSNNYRRLLDGENEKFVIGESSVFLVNTREQRWLEAQLKYLKLLSELRKTEAGLQWAAGVLGE